MKRMYQFGDNDIGGLIRYHSKSGRTADCPWFFFPDIIHLLLRGCRRPLVACTCGIHSLVRYLEPMHVGQFEIQREVFVCLGVRPAYVWIRFINVRSMMWVDWSCIIQKVDRLLIDLKSDMLLSKVSLSFHTSCTCSEEAGLFLLATIFCPLMGILAAALVLLNLQG